MIYAHLTSISVVIYCCLRVNVGELTQLHANSCRYLSNNSVLIILSLQRNKEEAETLNFLSTFTPRRFLLFSELKLFLRLLRLICVLIRRYVKTPALRFSRRKKKRRKTHFSSQTGTASACCQATQDYSILFLAASKRIPAPRVHGAQTLEPFHVQNRLTLGWKCDKLRDNRSTAGSKNSQEGANGQRLAQPDTLPHVHAAVHGESEEADRGGFVNGG